MLESNQTSAWSPRQRPLHPRQSLCWALLSTKGPRESFSRPRVFAEHPNSRRSQQSLCWEPTVGRRPKKVAVNGSRRLTVFETLFADCLMVPLLFEEQHQYKHQCGGVLSSSSSTFPLENSQTKGHTTSTTPSWLGQGKLEWDGYPMG
jgi:hypothetical protein